MRLGHVARGYPAVAAWIVHTVLVHAAAALTVALSPGRDALRPGFDGVSRYLVVPLSIWDGGWYWRIVKEGYGETESTAAFWPLYPTLVDLIASGSGLSPASAGVLVSSLAFLVSLIALQALVSDSYGVGVATRTVWLIALNPFAFFFSAFYTESLYLLLSVGAILSARRGRWTTAAILAVLVSLTRLAGLLVLVPTGIALLGQVRNGERRLIRPALQLTAAALGPVAFAVHLNRLWNDPLLMLHAQSHWRREFSLPWGSLLRGARRVELIYVNARQECLDGARSGDWPTCRDALQVSIDALSDDLALAAAIVALALVPMMIKRLVPGDAIFGIVSVLVPLCSGIPENPLVSLPRYLVVVYPLFIALAFLTQNRRLFALMVGASTVGLVWLLSIFARAWFVA